MHSARVHLRLPPDLVQYVKKYAAVRKSSVSEVLRQLLVELRRAEQASRAQQVRLRKRAKQIDAEQV